MLMILDQEIWMDIWRFTALQESGTTYADVARECGVDYPTVKKYLAADAPAVPPSGSPRAGTQPRAITPALEVVIRGMLKADVELKASVIHQRLVHEHGFTGHCQRVKMACRDLRPAVEDELAGPVDPWTAIGGSRRFQRLRHRSTRVTRVTCSTMGRWSTRSL